MPITKKAAPAATDYAPEADLLEEEPVAAAPVRTSSGWDAANKLADSIRRGGLTRELRLTESKQLVAFLPGPIPFDSFRQHWIKRQGQQSFVCLEVGCPLCDKLGDSPSAKFAFAVVAFEPSETDPDSVEPTAKLWVAGTRLMKRLQTLDTDPRKGPLAGSFYEVCRTGKGTSTDYVVDHIKARDLEEDWGIPEAAAIAELKRLGAEELTPIRRATKQELLDIALEKSAE